ncbi:hypothetical protein EDB80DRAFT_674578 [Ilyonectria destructans]|nr:hypothetical protein EDB80DRAFT_674578 [Ilyonectria destructans]
MSSSIVHVYVGFDFGTTYSKVVVVEHPCAGSPVTVAPSILVRNPSSNDLEFVQSAVGSIGLRDVMGYLKLALMEPEAHHDERSDPKLLQFIQGQLLYIYQLKPARSYPVSPGGLVCCTTPPVETAQLLPRRLLERVDDLPLLKLANLKDAIFSCCPKLVSQHGRPLGSGLWPRNWFSFLSTLPLSPTLYQGVPPSASFLVAFPNQSACCTHTFQETLICDDSSCE